MGQQSETGSRRSADGGSVVFERTYPTSAEALWRLWTTREGFESWWGPEGFRAEVLELEQKPGGTLRYAMIASAPEQVAFMKSAGMPLRHDVRATFSDYSPPGQLELVQRMDFIPGVAPYDSHARVELQPGGHETKMTVTLDVLHSEEWTQRALLGWESQLRKLSQRFGT